MDISSKDYHIIKVENGVVLTQSEQHTAAQKHWVFSEFNQCFEFMKTLMWAEITPNNELMEVK